MTTQERRSGRAHYAAALTATFTLALPAQAWVIESNVSHREADTGLFSGMLSYFVQAPDLGVLMITLTNETHPLAGGYITGFVFNINSTDPDATATLTSSTHALTGVVNHAAQPFGSAFSAGAATGGNWSGGGNPSEGIGVGENGTFTFSIAATDAGSLGPASFLSGPYDFNFVVRFRGFADGGSDKVPAMSHRIPGPTVLALFAVGGLLIHGRRRPR